MTVILACACNAQTRTYASLSSIVNEFSSEAGCDVVSVGRLGLDVISIIGKMSAESKEDKEVLSMLGGINRILVVDFEDMEVSKRQMLNSKLTDVLDGVEKIVEVKDEEDTLLVYGTLGKGGETIEDVIVYIPEDGALICFWGSIDFNKLSDLIKATNESI